MNIYFVSDEMVEMIYQCTEEFVEESGRTNVVIAAYTTAQARLKLYSYLEQLGPRALYADIDSAVYTSRPGEWGGKEGGREGGRDTFHVFMSAVKMALLVNLISHYVVDIS